MGLITLKEHPIRTLYECTDKMHLRLFTFLNIYFENEYKRAVDKLKLK